MKTKLALTLLALAAVSLNLQAATSALPAPLPEFMDQQQLAKWTAAQTAVATDASANEPSTQFYTGKPYVANAGGYVFKYRTYDPEMSRWTSADPSGFPDGANNKSYAPCPTRELDPQGMLTVNVSGVPVSTTSGSVLTITGDSSNGSNGATYLDNGTVFYGISNVTYSITNNQNISGWIVQEVQITYSVTNANGSTWTDPLIGSNPGYPSTFWEAWQVTNGSVAHSGGDTFQTSQYPDSSNGYVNVTGSVTFFSNCAVASSSPSGWGTLPISGLPSTATEPSWWAGNSTYAHDLQMSWSE